jgi:hypothetical protein
MSGVSQAKTAQCGSKVQGRSASANGENKDNAMYGKEAAYN